MGFDTRKMRGRPVTSDEAAKSVQRLINSHFHNKDSARCSIPVRADDDDIVASDYVLDSSEQIATLERQLSDLRQVCDSQKAALEGKWISVDDPSLPVCTFRSGQGWSEKQYVLVIDAKHRMAVALFMESSTSTPQYVSGKAIGQPTHYQPLPPAPKEATKC